MNCLIIALLVTVASSEQLNLRGGSRVLQVTTGSTTANPTVGRNVQTITGSPHVIGIILFFVVFSFDLIAYSQLSIHLFIYSMTYINSYIDHDSFIYCI